ncbi:hypothetical protein [Aestuariirhabdus litorea]|uniref:DUF4136 domain-containing protein n=1 Tax=Aestuariirhabdus litorea TaxID=2528527 RepID=A0A3P3VV18_9GAMM|nr:hypothetical protein [Aestuariirhabdus litorea]RRJ85279.1 hypothetical protein D0544_09515 [Aestuariirhabdus litorea]RWW98500.1 hypothetical protein DZC74_09500 [Endozoicomonadaceae bacterium GTF-13]
MKRTLIAIGIAFITLLTGCATSQVTSEWKDPDFSGPLTHVLIISTAKETRDRRMVEDRFARMFTERGIKATTWYQASGKPEVSDINKEAVISAAKRIGADSVMVSRLVGTEEGQDYIPPRTEVSAPFDYYDRANRGFDRDYPSLYSYTQTGGYYVDYTVFKLEFNLYEMKNKELVWSILSEAFDPQSQMTLLEELTKQVSSSLEKGTLIPPQK